MKSTKNNYQEYYDDNHDRILAIRKVHYDVNREKKLAYRKSHDEVYVYAFDSEVGAAGDEVDSKFFIKNNGKKGRYKREFIIHDGKEIEVVRRGTYYAREWKVYVYAFDSEVGAAGDEVDSKFFIKNNGKKGRYKKEFIIHDGKEIEVVRRTAFKLIKQKQKKNIQYSSAKLYASKKASIYASSEESSDKEASAEFLNHDDNEKTCEERYVAAYQKIKSHVDKNGNESTSEEGDLSMDKPCVTFTAKKNNKKIKIHTEDDTPVFPYLKTIKLVLTSSKSPNNFLYAVSSGQDETSKKKTSVISNFKKVRFIFNSNDKNENKTNSAVNNFDQVSDQVSDDEVSTGVVTDDMENANYQPEYQNLECERKVNKLPEENWDDTFTDFISNDRSDDLKWDWENCIVVPEEVNAANTNTPDVIPVNHLLYPVDNNTNPSISNTNLGFFTPPAVSVSVTDLRNNAEKNIESAVEIESLTVKI